MDNQPFHERRLARGRRPCYAHEPYIGFLLADRICQFSQPFFMKRFGNGNKIIDFSRIYGMIKFRQIMASN